MIASAAADVAFECMTNLCLRGFGIVLQQVGSRHDHAWGTEAALQSMFLMKPFLQGVKIAIGGKAFNGRDFTAIRLNREQGTTLDRLSIEVNGACAAPAGIATYVCACETQRVSQIMNEQRPGFNIVTVSSPVDLHIDLHK